MTRRRRLRWAACAALLAAAPARPIAADASAPAASAADSRRHATVRRLPRRDAVRSFLGHGMARSLGPAGRGDDRRGDEPVEPHSIRDLDGAQGPLLTATFPDGGIRRQRIVGRIGAGIFDTSWVGAGDRRQRRRHRRASSSRPSRPSTGHGLALSPFELHRSRADFAGMALPRRSHAILPRACRHHRPGPARGPCPPIISAPTPSTTCRRSAARRATAIPAVTSTSPPARRRRRRGRRRPPAAGPPRPGRAAGRLRALPSAGRRPHRVPGCTPPATAPLAGRIPVLVPRRALADDFRFVGQLERLALSACFRRLAGHDLHDLPPPAQRRGRAGRGELRRRLHQVPRGDRPRPHHAHRLRGRRPPRAQPRRLCGLPRAPQRALRPAARPQRRPFHPAAHRAPAPRRAAPAVRRPRRARSSCSTTGGWPPASPRAEGRRWQAGVLAMGLLPMLRVDGGGRALREVPAAGLAGGAPAHRAGRARRRSRPSRPSTPRAGWP